ncbi:MAG: DUF1987 domain-containing protein [Flavobacteriales bacterium]|nr:DUF1987 domain-containing protein [Flavobacteriales bacterium]
MALSQPFRSAATGKTPDLALDPAKGELTVRGCSIPENADKAYGPLMDALELYLGAPAARTRVVVELSYFNSSTAKYLLDLFKRIDDAHGAGITRAVLEWHHAASDLDMLEVGRDYQNLLEFPVKLVESGL